jgi:phosphatidylglycerophosphate synthase
MLFIGLTDFIDGAMYEFIRDGYKFENKYGIIIDALCDRIFAICFLFYILHLDFINKALLGMELTLGIAIIITFLWPDLKKYKIQTHRGDYLGKTRYLILWFFFLFSYYFGYINPVILSNNIFANIKLAFLIIILSLVFVSFIYFILLNLLFPNNKVIADNQKKLK